jgi:hypothetical protein
MFGSYTLYKYTYQYRRISIIFISLTIGSYLLNRRYCGRAFVFSHKVFIFCVFLFYVFQNFKLYIQYNCMQAVAVICLADSLDTGGGRGAGGLCWGEVFHLKVLSFVLKISPMITEIQETSDVEPHHFSVGQGKNCFGTSLNYVTSIYCTSMV